MLFVTTYIYVKFLKIKFSEKYNTEAYIHPNANFRSRSFSNTYNFNVQFLTYLITCDSIYLVERYLNEVQ